MSSDGTVLHTNISESRLSESEVLSGRLGGHTEHNYAKTFFLILGIKIVYRYITECAEPVHLFSNSTRPVSTA